MAVAEVGFILVPPCTPRKIIAIDHLQFVHLISTFIVEADFIQINGALKQFVLNVDNCIYDHNDIIDDL